ncbi:MAG: hypothetical protein IJT37_07320 [Lachnospiraceae bacterium]|nr:hypothetical protein [Lachnospiraceae bacterium]
MNIIDWHVGFVSAMKLELIESKDNLIYDEEHHIANRAQRIDLLIIKNAKDVPISNPIGAIFSKFNICEYKSPDDSLTYGDFYKVLAYTSLYLIEAQRSDKYSAGDYTMTFVREAHPYKLFKRLKVDGININCIHPGIYELTDNLPFRTQVIVTKELANTTASWLKCLTRKGTTDELKGILQGTPGLDEYHKKYADNIMDIFTTANKEFVLSKTKEDKTMCRAVNELFEDEELQNVLKEVLKQDVEQELRQDIEQEIKQEMEKQLADKDSVIADKDSIIAQLQAQLDQALAANTANAN